MILVNCGKKSFPVKKGERIAQLVLVKIATLMVQEVSLLDETSHGTGGFGSTGLGSIASTHLLQLEQLRDININPDLTEHQ